MLMTGFDHDDVIGSLRRAVETVCDTCRFSALNFLFCDGRRMYAYRFGVYRLFWLPRDLDLDADTDTHHHVHLERPSGGHMVLAASERLTEAEPWIEMEQDELLVCDPDDAEHPRVERLLGDRADGRRVRAARLRRAERRGARRVGGEARGVRLLSASEPHVPGRSRRAQRLARVMNNVVTRAPWTWRLVRGPMTRFFERAAPTWDARFASDPRAPGAADRRARPPPHPTGARTRRRDRHRRRGPDRGRALARTRRSLGIDVSPAMIDEAAAKQAPARCRVPGGGRGAARPGRGLRPRDHAEHAAVLRTGRGAAALRRLRGPHRLARVAHALLHSGQEAAPGIRAPGPRSRSPPVRPGPGRTTLRGVRERATASSPS